MNENKELHLLKLKIKVWEKEFLTGNGRKADKEDIKNAPSDIVDLYSEYWKLKRSSQDNEVWSPAFNMSHQQPKSTDSGKTKKILGSYLDKLKERSNLTSTFKNILKKPFAHNTHCPTELREEVMDAAPSEIKDQSTLPGKNLTLHSSQTNKESPAKYSSNKNEITTSEEKSQNMSSPVKHISTPKTLYFKKSLDTSWLSRCSISEDYQNPPLSKPSKQFSQILDSKLQNESPFRKQYAAVKLNSQWFKSEDEANDYTSAIKPKESLSQNDPESNIMDNISCDSVSSVSNIEKSSSREIKTKFSLDIKARKSSVHMSVSMEDSPPSKNELKSMESGSLKTGKTKYNHSASNNYSSKTIDTCSELNSSNDLGLLEDRSQLSSNSVCDFCNEGDTDRCKDPEPPLKRKRKSLKSSKEDEIEEKDNSSDLSPDLKKPKKSLGQKQNGKSKGVANKIATNRIKQTIKKGQISVDDEGNPEVSRANKRTANKIKQSSKKGQISVDDEGNPEVSTARYVGALRKCPEDAVRRKLESGTVNDNFIRVNLKKKKYSRGHHKLNVKKFKFKQWKKNKKGSSGTGNCFKCGKLGHWANSCPGMKDVEEFESVEDAEEVDFNHLPTLEEAAMMAQGIKKDDSQKLPTKIPANVSTLEEDQQSITEESEVPNMPCSIPATIETQTRSVEPYLELDEYGSIPETPDIVFQVLRKMGFNQFRPGQESAIMRILCGFSTLLVLATGSGKSLCYQLPAYLYAQKTKCITLVISPLISLMEDQVTDLPPCLKAVCLHSGMAPAQKQASLDAIKEGDAHIALVSPEAVVSSSGPNGLLAKLPPVAFACIDEAHCLSEWSHNFRPSYLQLHKILTRNLKVHCILALTATATRTTCLSIAQHLGIEDVSTGIIGSSLLPQNLILSVSKEKNRDEALIEMLRGERLNSCESIIVYCTRREETERLASLIRTCLQTEVRRLDSSQGNKKANKRSYLMWDAEAYHAGMTSYKRRSVQKKFMNGKLRVIVATVAFGMGIDKSDIRAIIHYNMPKSFENYVQEVGRAGRDGLTSHCHLFLESEGKDENELKRHIHANSTDRYIIRKLLRKIFIPCACRHGGKILNEVIEEDTNDKQEVSLNCSKHEVAIKIDGLIQELDMKEENILTLLCFLELHHDKILEVLKPVYATCTIRCYGGPKQLKEIACKSPPVAAAMALFYKKGKEAKITNSITFPVVDVASHMGWDSKLVKRDLKSLEWDTSLLARGGKVRKSGVIVEFSDLSFHLMVKGSLSDEMQDELLDYLFKRVQKQEETELNRLKQVYVAFESIAYGTYSECCDTVSESKSDELKNILKSYFRNEEYTLDAEQVSSSQVQEFSIDGLRQDIRSLVSIHREHTFTGRAVARVFHGIPSPCFPAEVWGRVRRFWRSYLHADFNTIIKIANEELIHFR